MGGLEPVKTVRRKKKNASDSDAPAAVSGAVVSSQEISGPGFVFVQRLTAYVEHNFTDYEVFFFFFEFYVAVSFLTPCQYQGLYRLSGQKSKFSRLVDAAVSKNKKVPQQQQRLILVG